LVLAGGANEFGLAYNGGAVIRNYANSPMKFFTNNTERMVISSTGNVGIGTTTPSTKLDVAGEIKLSTTGLSAPTAGAGAMRYASSKLELSDGTDWALVLDTDPPFSASGGTVTTSGAYTIHTFTSSGTFTVPSGVVGTVDVLVVAGGGAGSIQHSGGGGAGGLIYQTGKNMSAGSYSVLISAGVVATSHNPTDDSYQTTLPAASDTTFDGLTAKGGGCGAPWNSNAGGSGGSGGGGNNASGGSGIQPSQGGDSGTYGHGYNGGNGTSTNYGSAGGGAGGAGGANSAPGGIGKQININGSNNWYAAGGSGAYNSIRQNGIGGHGNGNNNGNTNTGSGGGGSPDNTRGGNGGSGIVIIKYAT
jgi:hypothetical protein